MYTLTNSETDSHDAEAVIIICQACGYFKEHFHDKKLHKLARPCDHCQGRGRKP